MRLVVQCTTYNKIDYISILQPTNSTGTLSMQGSLRLTPINTH